MEIAESGHQGDGMGLRVRRMILRHRADTEQSTAQQLRQNFHLVKPPEVDLKFETQAIENREPGGRPCKCAQLMPN
jgi:hypothetical protein